MNLKDAIKENNVEKVRNILKKTKGSELLLSESTMYKKCTVEMAEVILHYCGGLEEGYHGHTPLYNASERCDIELIKFFLEKGANPNVAEYVHNLTPLHWANRSYEAAKLLVNAGANILVENDCGSTPLYFAAAGGHTDVVNLFLSHIDRGSLDGETDLLYSIWIGDIKRVKALWKLGERLEGEPSCLSSKERHEMFMNGHDFNHEKPYNPLVHAAGHGHFNLVKFFYKEYPKFLTEWDELGRGVLDVVKENSLIFEYVKKIQSAI